MPLYHVVVWQKGGPGLNVTIRIVADSAEEALKLAEQETGGNAWTAILDEDLTEEEEV